MKSATIFLCALLFLATGSGARAATEFFHATLVATDGSGSSAGGTATLQLDADRGEVSYEITVQGLGSAEIGAHIHAADGSILHQLPAGEVKNGVWSGLGLPQIFQLRQESLFILIHTQDNPGGEVRGDVLAGKVPVTKRSVAEVKGQY